MDEELSSAPVATLEEYRRMLVREIRRLEALQDVAAGMTRPTAARRLRALQTRVRAVQRLLERRRNQPRTP